MQNFGGAGRFHPAEVVVFSFTCPCTGGVASGCGDAEKSAVLDSTSDATTAALEKYMDLLSVRQKLITSNIANVDTPGYKTQDIDFQSEFQSAINGAGNPIEVPGLKTNNDGNNVNLDRENRLLSETALRFNVATQLMRSQLATLKSAIDEGKSA